MNPADAMPFSKLMGVTVTAAASLRELTGARTKVPGPSPMMTRARRNRRSIRPRPSGLASGPSTAMAAIMATMDQARPSRRRVAISHEA